MDVKNNQEFESMPGFTSENWIAAETFQQVLDEPVGAWLSYTRESYLSPSEFKKLSAESKGRIDRKRKRVTCVIKEIDRETGTVVVSSTPRKFKDPKREVKIASWSLRDGMKGDCKFYLQKVKTPQEIEVMKENKRLKRGKTAKLERTKKDE